MDIKYNADIGAFVNTANDEPVTQAELLEWAAANPEPIKEDKKPNTEIGRASCRERVCMFV